MPSPFVKGNKLSKGRPKGSLNSQDFNSLRKLLEEGFSDNRLVIRQMITAMFTNTSKAVEKISVQIENCTDPLEIATLCRARSNMLEDFKWLLNLKAGLEPKQVEAPPQRGGIILIRSERPVEAELVKNERVEPRIQIETLAG